jgi:hypothetical protein
MGVLHVECPEYRDASFPERLFWYHLGLVIRHRPRPVRTIALWLITPPAGQRIETITIGETTVRTTAVILPAVPAEILLSEPRAACFAAGADAGPMGDAELCTRVARALRQSGASWAQRHMAVVAAAVRGRYESMVGAMSNENIEPVIIEDLVKFGEDRGLARGREEGREEGLVTGLAEALLAVIRARGFSLDASLRERIEHAQGELVLRWLERAVTAASVSEIFRDDV